MFKRIYAIAIIAILSMISINSNISLNIKFLELDDKTNLCCQKCTGEEEKYYSIDPIFNFCGECCMKPSLFWVYKVFEPTLKKAETNTPCADKKYTIYKSTPTHGVWPVTMTLDLYDKSPKNIEN